MTVIEKWKNPYNLQKRGFNIRNNSINVELTYDNISTKTGTLVKIALHGVGGRSRFSVPKYFAVLVFRNFSSSVPING